MIATLLGGIVASPLARAAIRYGAIALDIVLFLLALRRSGARIGRIAERLESSEKANDVQRQMLDAAARVLATVTTWLSGCATSVSDAGGLAACPPIVEYSRSEQQRAADEIAAA